MIIRYMIKTNVELVLYMLMCSRATIITRFFFYKKVVYKNGATEAKNKHVYGSNAPNIRKFLNTTFQFHDHDIVFTASNHQNFLISPIFGCTTINKLVKIENLRKWTNFDKICGQRLGTSSKLNFMLRKS